MWRFCILKETPQNLVINSEQVLTWKTSSGKVVKIKKPGKGRAITSLKVNGQENKGYFVSHDLFKQGGTIEIATK